MQLTESARGDSSLRVQSIVRFCTRSNVVFEKCRGREIAEAKLGCWLGRWLGLIYRVVIINDHSVGGR